MDVQPIFTELLQRAGFPESSISQNWEALKNAYSAQNRHYHNLSHLEEMLSCFLQYKTKLQFPDETLYSLFYHDFVYNSSRNDNEEKSAAFAADLLPSPTSLNKQAVRQLILATKDHNTNGEADAKWLIDFDLKILSKNWDDYKMYAEQIRKEYSQYPDLLYKPGRRKALQHFLQKPFIYQTQTFREAHETKARQNIQNEILSLQP